MSATVLGLADRALRLSSRLSWLPPLAVRLVLGLVFLRTGWGKLHSLDSVEQFFASLGIPAPGVHAVLVGAVELVGGALLLAGLGTRLAALALAGTMAVAIVTAIAPQAGSLLDLTATVELAYLAMLAGLIVTGAGALSLDHRVACRWRR